MREKYRIISLLDEIVIDLRDFVFIISEESSPDRDTHSFFIWKLIELLGYSEKCEIWNLRTWDLERFEESGTLLIADDDEVSLLEEFAQHHFIFHLFDLERYTEIDDSRTSHTCYLGAKVPLPEKSGEAYSFFIIEYESSSSDDHDISSSDTHDISHEIPYISEGIMEKCMRKIRQP
jgi:hypothetical protein